MPVSDEGRAGRRPGARGARALVAAQAGLAMVMIVRAARPPWRTVSILLVLAGAGLHIWSLAAMRLGQLNMLPEMKRDAELRTTGPYARVRHPMYSGLLLGCLGLVVQRPDAAMAVCWVLLLVVLIAKISREEAFLRAAFPAYHEYARRSWRLAPWLY